MLFGIFLLALSFSEGIYGIPHQRRSADVNHGPSAAVHDSIAHVTTARLKENETVDHASPLVSSNTSSDEKPTAISIGSDPRHSKIQPTNDTKENKDGQSQSALGPLDGPDNALAKNLSRDDRLIKFLSQEKSNSSADSSEADDSASVEYEYADGFKLLERVKRISASQIETLTKVVSATTAKTEGGPSAVSDGPDQVEKPDNASKNFSHSVITVNPLSAVNDSLKLGLANTTAECFITNTRGHLRRRALNSNSSSSENQFLVNLTTDIQHFLSSCPDCGLIDYFLKKLESADHPQQQAEAHSNEKSENQKAHTGPVRRRRATDNNGTAAVEEHENNSSISVDSKSAGVESETVSIDNGDSKNASASAVTDEVVSGVRNNTEKTIDNSATVSSGQENPKNAAEIEAQKQTEVSGTDSNVTKSSKDDVIPGNHKNASLQHAKDLKVTKKAHSSNLAVVEQVQKAPEKPLSTRTKLAATVIQNGTKLVNDTATSSTKPGNSSESHPNNTSSLSQKSPKKEIIGNLFRYHHDLAETKDAKHSSLSPSTTTASLLKFTKTNGEQVASSVTETTSSTTPATKEEESAEEFEAAVREAMDWQGNRRLDQTRPLTMGPLGSKLKVSFGNLDIGHLGGNSFSGEEEEGEQNIQQMDADSEIESNKDYVESSGLMNRLPLTTFFILFLSFNFLLRSSTAILSALSGDFGRSSWDLDHDLHYIDIPMN